MELTIQDTAIKPIEEAKTLSVLQLYKLHPQSPAFFSYPSKDEAE